MKQMNPFNKVKYSRIELPQFASEREEAEWWDTHQDEVGQFIERAERAGAVTRGTVGRELATKPVNIRLFVDDIQGAKAIANRKGLKFQTYIKMVIHEAVEKEKAS